jgi:hypothetical protein
MRSFASSTLETVMRTLPSPITKNTSPKATSVKEALPPEVDETESVLEIEPEAPGETFTVQSPAEFVVPV